MVMKLTLNRFYKNTRQLVLFRGIRYHQEGRVKLEKKADGTYYFDVKGESSTYHVVINVGHDDAIVFASCDCPYSDAGYCKHQVSSFMEILKQGDRLQISELQQKEGLKEKHKSKAVPQGWSPEDFKKLQTFDVADYLTSFTRDELIYIMINYMKQDTRLFMYLFHHFMVEQERIKIKDLS